MKLDMVGIIVEDMEASIKFYECINLTVADRFSDDYVELKHDGVRISLNTKTMIETVYGFKPSITGERIELAFLFESTEEVDALVDKVKAAGYKVLKEPFDAPWGQYYALLEDVDGNVISLFYNR